MIYKILVMIQILDVVCCTILSRGTQWCSWLKHCATSQKVTGLIPNGVIGIFHWHNPSSCTMVLGSTQSLTDMSTRSTSWGWRWPGLRADNLSAFMCQLSWNLEASTSWNPQGLSIPLMGLLCFASSLSLVGGFSQQWLLFSMLVSSSITNWAISIWHQHVSWEKMNLCSFRVSEKYEFGSIQRMLPFLPVKHFVYVCIIVFFSPFYIYCCPGVCTSLWSSIASSVLDHNDHGWLLSHSFLSFSSILMTFDSILS